MAGIFSNIISDHEDAEIEAIYESVLDDVMGEDDVAEMGSAMEAAEHILTSAERDALPDSAFGVPSARKYPLRVENKNKERELVMKAVQFFHYARADWKQELANNIKRAIVEDKLDVKVHPSSTLLKLVEIPTENIDNRGTDGRKNRESSK